MATNAYGCPTPHPLFLAPPNPQVDYASTLYFYNQPDGVGWGTNGVHPTLPASSGLRLGLSGLFVFLRMGYTLVATVFCARPYSESVQANPKTPRSSSASAGPPPEDFWDRFSTLSLSLLSISLPL